VVANFDVPSFHNAKRCIDLFRRLDYGKDKVLLVINRYVANEVFNPEAVEKSIGYPIFWRIPNQEYNTVIRSINEGLPLSLSMPKCRLSRNLHEMMDQLNGTLNLVASENEVKSKPNLFRKLLSRDE
jgi:pilus assembly protein CpaE